MPEGTPEDMINCVRGGKTSVQELWQGDKSVVSQRLLCFYISSSLLIRSSIGYELHTMRPNAAKSKDTERKPETRNDLGDISQLHHRSSVETRT
ncbi:hypothetical protein RRG08_009773 [Elysia crispata]|uniref:Uncharacterized protein n=1 Tax=Elysia crispata TaxID=231223 RepID=A0AAE0ZRS5_9GAST|nr:hypothetical protein RRG08_009773 [Elysia crispata]